MTNYALFLEWQLTEKFHRNYKQTILDDMTPLREQLVIQVEKDGVEYHSIDFEAVAKRGHKKALARSDKLT